MGRPAQPIVIGSRFNMLTITSFEGRSVVCKCDCGNETTLPFNRIRSGNTKSCGCFKSTNTYRYRHGGKGTVEYHAWNCMRQRCLDPNHRDYKIYGARGITICDRWLAGEDGQHPFTCFLADMGPRPSEEHSLGRRENDGNYEPGNCRWETPTQQIRNRSNSITILFQGRRVHINEAALASGIKLRTIVARRNAGWPESEWLAPLKR
jgi:hypothetical protein